MSGDFFRVLRATPVRGRVFSADDARIGAAPVAVVSASFWQRALGGGELTYSVTRRTKEIAVRVALGARAGSVLAMVVGDSMRPVAWGALLGIAGALALSRLLRGLVYGIGVTDPATFLAATALLVGVALVASWIPARRAARVDPVIALRGE